MSILIAGTASAQGYEITVKIKNLSNDTLILGHHFNERLIPDDTIKLNAQGMGVFKGKEKLPGGMYFIFLPSRNYFDIMIDGSQKFTIENDTTDFLKNMVITGSIENQRFHDYQVVLQDASKQYQQLSQELEKVKGKESKEADIREKMKAVSQMVDKEYQKQITEYPNQFFSKFLTATRDVEIPADIKDQNERFFWYKAHFFDNFQISDQRLLRTSIYQPKIEKYITNMCFQMPDSLIRETTWLVNQTRHNDELFRFMLVFLFNKYAKQMSEDMFSENVYCSLAEIYCKDAKWDTDSFKIELRKKINRKENCLMGNVSKDLLMKMLPNNDAAIDALRPALDKMEEEGLKAEEKTKGDFEARRNDVVQILDKFINNFGKDYYSVHQMDAKYKVIVFWEPDCSHCKEEMPKLFDFYRDTLSTMDCKVFAVYMNKSVDNFKDLHRHVGKWFDYVKEKQFYLPGWYNLFNPFDQYRENFDVNSTPTFYLLNRKNEIIAKRISYHQMYELINYLNEHGE